MSRINASLSMRALLFAMIGVIGIGTSALAWGPDRETYTNAEPAPQAVFNSITDNAAVGDERDFVRIVEVNEDGERNTYSNEVVARAGHDYEVFIYYHNNASSTFNSADYDFKGVATSVRASASFPVSIKAGEKKQVDAIISSERSIIPDVWDEAYLIADEDLTFSYIKDSAKIFNDGEVNGSILSIDLFSAQGVYIGYNSLDGLIPGCDQYSGVIVFRIRASAVKSEE